MKTRILVVEDEVKIARFLELELKHEGYDVDIAYDGREGYEKAVSEKFDLIILDLMLPGLSGIEVCRRVRRESDIPIIMLTAKDDVSDKVMGLDSGADDYMTKTFAIEELLARIRVILKRKGKRESNNSNNTLESGKLVMYRDEHRVTYNDKEVSLSKKEFELLKYLMENRGIVLSREKILDHVWGYDYYGDTNVTDVYVRYLRNKIDQKFDVHYIHTIRGVGYLFKENEKSETQEPK